MANTTFSMSNATYGRDTAGRKKLLADLTGDLKKVRAELTGSELTNLLNEVSKYWVGADADKFKKLIKDDITYADSEIKKLIAELEKDFDTDSNQFAKMQSTIANSMK